MSAQTQNMNTVFNGINQFVMNFFESANVDSEVSQLWSDEWSQDLQNLITKLLKNVTEKKKRSKKAKDAPKNARSAYMFFCQEMRSVVKEENAELNSKEITVKLGERWKSIKETEDAKKYVDMAATDKDRYKEEMANYVPSSESESESENKKDKKKRTKKPKDAPKNARSAYIFFCQEMRSVIKEENSELTPKEITSKLGEMWKEIKDTDGAKKYNDLAIADKDRYKEEMTNYVPSECENSESESSESESDGEAKKANKAVNKKKRTKKPKDAPKNARSAYMFFCQEMRSIVKEENPELAAKDITIKLGEMWKEIKETDDVKKYNDLAAADKNRYKEDMENYSSDSEKSENEKSEKNKNENTTKTAKPSKAPKKAVRKIKDDEQSNEEIVRDIINSNDNDNITMKFIREKLTERNVEIAKDELKAIINKINDEED